MRENAINDTAQCARLRANCNIEIRRGFGSCDAGGGGQHLGKRREKTVTVRAPLEPWDECSSRSLPPQLNEYSLDK